MLAQKYPALFWGAQPLWGFAVTTRITFHDLHLEKGVQLASQGLFELDIWVFPKIGVPQIIHFSRVFHYKPSILGVPLFLETPIYIYIWIFE